MDNDILMQVNNLTRYYGDNCAVHQVSFVLAKGQVLGFLGANGAGKSTTLQMLAGCLAPHTGHIVINGCDLREEPLRAKTAIGYLPERPPLYPELTVDEYLSYCARLHRVPPQALHDAVTRAKQHCGLTSMGRRLLGNLSRGYQQRVGIAQAIIHRPAVILLDEPTAGLDPLQIREIRTLIRELGESHGIILSSHILPEVQTICSHVQILKEGHLVYSSSLAQLDQHRQSFIAGFDSAPDNDTLGALSHITHVETLGNGRFRLHHTGHSNAHTVLVEQACAQGWGLRELVPESTDLEHVFIDLTMSQEENLR